MTYESTNYDEKNKRQEVTYGRDSRQANSEE